MLCINILVTCITGAEICEADVDNKDSLPATVKEAYSCFLVTDYFQHLDQQREIKQVKIKLLICNFYVAFYIVFANRLLSTLGPTT